MKDKEDGRIALLTLGLTLIVVALVLASIAVTSIHVQRRELLTCADSIALSVAGAASAKDYYEGADAPLASEGADQRAQAMFARLSTSTCDVGTSSWLSSVRADGAEVVVELGMNPKVPGFTGVLDFINQPLTIRVVASAKMH
ncbi:MAG: hypothetical protein Q4E01_04230 [Actinomycetaceae bacterium]|nr:hypothetical protein [Actinomycetaceae bacterium]